jgi:glycosyltransferase involved in cell wall biosynthesis
MIKFSMLKILGMEESESLIYEISKFIKKSEIKILNLKSKKRKFLIETEQINFFDSSLIKTQIKFLQTIKNQFDICIVSSWSTARLAYFANLNYIIYFVGHDIRTPPFEKNNTVDYFEKSLFNFGFFERKFYREVLNNAVSCVTGSQELFSYLKKYRNDAYRIDRVFVDPTIFNPNIEPVLHKKTKFTFFSPQRIGVEKGTHILWDALKLCKNDFDVLQINWIDDRTQESKITSEKILKTIPHMVTLIDKIPHSEIGKYYSFVDAVLGEMMTGHTNSIEREAALCKKPVLNYNDPNMKSFLDGKEISSPFLPQTQNINELSELIDKIVDSQKFREDLAKKEYAFMMNLTNLEKTSHEWDELFLKSYLKCKIKSKINFYKKYKSKFFFLIMKIQNNFEKQLP